MFVSLNSRKSGSRHAEVQLNHKVAERISFYFLFFLEPLFSTCFLIALVNCLVFLLKTSDFFFSYPAMQALILFLSSLLSHKIYVVEIYGFLLLLPRSLQGLAFAHVR